jgi:hypothetical protein
LLTLGEISRILHLGDETWEGNLANKSVRNVEEGAHARDIGCTSDRDLGHKRLIAWSVARRVILDARKDNSEQDGNAHGHSRESTEMGELAKLAGEGDEEAEDGRNSAECDGTRGRAREGVEELGADEAMEGLDEGVVEDEEDCSGVVRELRAPEQLAADIAHVPDLGVLETIPPKDEGSVLNAYGDRNGHDHAGHHT